MRRPEQQTALLAEHCNATCHDFPRLVYHDMRYTRRMARAISVRLDDEAERALRSLEAAGLSRSEAIRSSLIASARRLRRSAELAAEVAALEADEQDRDEMVAVAGLMESLRATR